MLKSSTSFFTKKLIPSAILALGIVLLVLGIYRGEPTEILQKAILVCLECIGIG